ncbi:hypothetical protein A2U01_0083475, partial [Trifolium medium]|nr:hypothetical protein [Trifolium medium]
EHEDHLRRTAPSLHLESYRKEKPPLGDCCARPFATTGGG